MKFNKLFALMAPGILLLSLSARAEFQEPAQDDELLQDELETADQYDLNLNEEASDLAIREYLSGVNAAGKKMLVTVQEMIGLSKNSLSKVDKLKENEQTCKKFETLLTSKAQETNVDSWNRFKTTWQVYKGVDDEGKELTTLEKGKIVKVGQCPKMLLGSILSRKQKCLDKAFVILKKINGCIAEAQAKQKAGTPIPAAPSKPDVQPPPPSTPQPPPPKEPQPEPPPPIPHGPHPDDLEPDDSEEQIPPPSEPHPDDVQPPPPPETQKVPMAPPIPTAPPVSQPTAGVPKAPALPAVAVKPKPAESKEPVAKPIAPPAGSERANLLSDIKAGKELKKVIPAPTVKGPTLEEANAVCKKGNDTKKIVPVDATIHPSGKLGCDEVNRRFRAAVIQAEDDDEEENMDD